MWTPRLNAELPAYQALADAIAGAVSAGELQPGQQLPPQRELADQLGVTLGTISRGYQLAGQRGLTQGEVGRGTFVRGQPRGLNPFSVSAQPRALVDLSMNIPSPVHDPKLATLLSQLGDHSQHLLRYQDPRGIKAHREAGVAWLAGLGVESDESDVMICAGAQHAIFLCMLAFAKPGSSVLCEELSYPGVSAAARCLGVNLQGVPLDEQGMLPDALDRALRRTRAKLVYAVPTLHNPTTASMSSERRQRIAQTLEHHGALLIEDDILGLLVDRPPPPIASLLPAQTLFIGSLSKLIAGGLRVAYLRAPKALHAKLSPALQASGWMTSPLAGELAAQLIQSGQAARITQLRRAEMRQRNALAQRLLGSRCRCTGNAYHAWLELPAQWSADAFSAELAQRGVLVRAASAFYIGRGAAPAAVRLSLSGASTEQELAFALDEVQRLLQADRGAPAL